MIRRHKGFTLIELVLAMAFISVLLLAIALTAIQAGRLYNRGLVLSSINQAGRNLSDIIRRDFLQAAYKSDFAVVNIMEGEYSSGRFCTGQYSYVWNSPKVLDRLSDADIATNNAVVRTSDNRPINAVRLIDSTGAWCQQSPTGSYLNVVPIDNVTTLLRTQSSEGDVVLALHDLRVAPLTPQDTREGLYRINFVIGTSVVSEINTSKRTCKPPNDDEANADFCAINNFEMIVRTNG